MLEAEQGLRHCQLLWVVIETLGDNKPPLGMAKQKASAHINILCWLCYNSVNFFFFLWVSSSRVVPLCPLVSTGPFALLFCPLEVIFPPAFAVWESWLAYLSLGDTWRDSSSLSIILLFPILELFSSVKHCSWEFVLNILFKLKLLQRDKLQWPVCVRARPSAEHPVFRLAVKKLGWGIASNL